MIRGRLRDARTGLASLAGALTRGRTVVAIAHRLHSVRHADQILVLDQGRLVEQGTHDQLLLRSGLYARLWERQMEARLWTMGVP